MEEVEVYTPREALEEIKETTYGVDVEDSEGYWENYQYPVFQCDDPKIMALEEAITELESFKDKTKPENIGSFSDGYHTFNELYHHRAVLFSLVCNMNLSIAWKSKVHHDGSMYKGMFIVGLNTPYGQATYHYDIDPYWDYFKVYELPMAPVWDGHTPEEAIQRLLKLSLN